MDWTLYYNTWFTCSMKQSQENIYLYFEIKIFLARLSSFIVCFAQCSFLSLSFIYLSSFYLVKRSTWIHDQHKDVFGKQLKSLFFLEQNQISFANMYIYISERCHSIVTKPFDIKRSNVHYTFNFSSFSHSSISDFNKTNSYIII
jgi:hypothetical protein